MKEGDVINDYKGYALFKDDPDPSRQLENRATVLANIIEKHSEDGKVNHNVSADMLGYLSAIPELERIGIIPIVLDVLKTRGIVITGLNL